jgi:hypothetical protein
MASEGALLVGTASATSTSTMGVIAGVVRECPPGANFDRTSPNPAMVIVVHKGHTWGSQSIAFPKKAPWTGSFRITIQPGTYQVISSYQGAVQTVTVRADRTATVSFGIIGCPE